MQLIIYMQPLCMLSLAVPQSIHSPSAAQLVRDWLIVLYISAARLGICASA